MDYILKHHGIRGQKWGVRRFQNADGTRTAAGKKRYAKRSLESTAKSVEKQMAISNKKTDKYQRKITNKMNKTNDAQKHEKLRQKGYVSLQKHEDLVSGGERVLSSLDVMNKKFMYPKASKYERQRDSKYRDAETVKDYYNMMALVGPDKRKALREIGYMSMDELRTNVVATRKARQAAAAYSGGPTVVYM